MPKKKAPSVFRPLTVIAFIGLAFWLVVVFLGWGGFKQIDTVEGLKLLKDGQVSQVKIIDGNQQRVDMVLKEDYKKLGKKVQFSYVTPRGEEIVKAVAEAKPEKGYTDEVVGPSIWSFLLTSFLPLLILLGVFWYFMMSAQGGGRAMQFGKSRAKTFDKDMPKVTFADVAGADEAVEEISEVKDFLVGPEKFQAVGAKIPKGILLYGPPGTGKTLLARAVAGEANVPFYSISGSDFVEMFVGVGASRVRDLFNTAKENAPAIIFVDEIDAVGRRRGAGMGGGNDEREQTLNQILVEMDGFEKHQNVILIAATNRPDTLDPALLRPGRFDRQIAVELPDLEGRKKILSVHAQGKPLSEDADLENIARRSAGMSGADLANVLNEAALLTARSGNQIIDNRALDEAVDRVAMGPQRYSKVMTDKERQMTAYHEGGHAIVAAALPNSAPVNKVTILPRGRAGGYTMVVPKADENYQTRNELLDRLAYAMGGYAVEEGIFHDLTTGPSSDLQNATKIARTMVTQLGMSNLVGQVALKTQDDAMMGYGAPQEYSDETARLIDEEVRRLIDNALSEAWSVIKENRPVLDRLVLELLEKETLNEKELAEIFKDVKKRPQRDVWQSSEDRPVFHDPLVGGKPKHETDPDAGAPVNGEAELPPEAHPGNPGLPGEPGPGMPENPAVPPTPGAQPGNPNPGPDAANPGL